VGNPGVKCQKSWENARKLLRNVAKMVNKCKNMLGMGKMDVGKAGKRQKHLGKMLGQLVILENLGLLKKG
jgi:hypothetical protein